MDVPSCSAGSKQDMTTPSNLDLYNFIRLNVLSIRLKHNVTLSSIHYCPVSVDDVVDDDDDDDDDDDM